MRSYTGSTGRHRQPGGQSARPRHLLHLGGGQGYYDTITKGQQVWY
ncbi:hypothetical protein [Streptomyces sp. NTH33]|nr:hypothetical protein [Streptomyces sp. NTH33]